jgi:hypothetical protein
MLGGEDSRDIQCLLEYRDTLICKGYDRTTDTAGGGWTTATMGYALAKASRLARLTHKVKIHDYRRMSAVMLLAKGEYI